MTAATLVLAGQAREISRLKECQESAGLPGRRQELMTIGVKS